MRTAIFIAIFLSAALAALGQTGSSLSLEIRNSETKRPIADAAVTVKDTGIGAKTDLSGRVSLSGIPSGEQTIEIFSAGYETAVLKLSFPLADASARTVFIKVTFEAGEVTVSSTRTGREIQAEPTRVEAIDEEEIDEKISMAPANVSMVVSESTGVQVQQTSATSNTQSVRIQGLDGRYTQILKDGFPSFGGFSGSLSLLDIPPLDLKQVEIIKGPNAPLYGAGAIAGVINFVSKTPEEKPVTTLVLNQTSALGTDFSLFNSRKFNKLGYTVLGSANYQREYDVNDDDFSELPRTHSFALQPRAFVYAGPESTITLGNAFSYQKRRGGDITAIQRGPTGTHQYVENNRSFRNVTTFSLDTTIDDRSRLAVRQSIAFFSRDLVVPGFAFKGDQINSYTDVAYFRTLGKNSLVLGANVVYDSFREDRPPTSPLDRSETRATIGGYVQNTVDLSEKLSMEAGFRVDHVREYGTLVLPRVSFLYRFSDRFTSRVGYGLGYKTPSVFTEEAEETLFQNVAGIGNTLRPERSQGGTFDLNYNGSVGENVRYSLNQLFYYTEVTHPLVLEPATGGLYGFRNANSPVITKGFETNAKLTYKTAKVFVGYTFTDARGGYLAGDRRLPLIARSKINSSFVLEKHESFKGGLEAYYSSPQTLDDRTRTRSLFEVGLFAEKIFERFSLFFNAENLTDVRQSRYGPVILGPHNSPKFAQIYTHLEGRLFNGGIKIRL